MNNKMLFYKNFFKYGLILALILVIVLVSVNIYQDKYGIFKNDYSKQKFWPNERFVKVKYILKNPTKYDSFIFGSSRAQLFNPKLIKTGHFYNCSFEVSSIYENLRYLKMFLEHGVKIKTVILCIENDSFMYGDNPYISYDMSYKHNCFYYPETIKQKIKFYSKYLFINPFNNAPNAVPFYDFNKNTMFDSGTVAQNMDLKTFKRSTKNIDKVYVNPFKYKLVNFKLLEEFTNVCKQNNINLIVIILPEHYKSYKANNLATYNYCKKRLSEITPYYDFSGINQITTNDFNFFDYMHLDYNVACAILDRIFYENKFTQPKIEDFGDYVTKDNFNEHIKKLCSKTPEIKNCIPDSNKKYYF